MAKNGKPPRRTSPVITPLKGIGLPEMRLKPELLSDSDIAHLRRKSAWTLQETAWTLCGYRMPRVPFASLNDLPQEVRQAVECMSAARITRDLTPIGPPDLEGRRNHLARDEVIKWVGGNFPKFPFTSNAASTTSTQCGADEPPKKRRQISEQNDEMVLTAIRAARFDPMALPPPNGKPGAKAAARALCTVKGRAFDHAWDRLLKDNGSRVGRIAYKR